MASHLRDKNTDAGARGAGSPGRKGGQRRRRGGMAPVVVASLAGILALAYFGGVALFSFRFLPNTTLDGRDVSLQNAPEVASQKTEALEGLSLHLTGDGVDLEVAGSDVGLTADGNAYAAAALEQQDAWAWPVQMFSSHALTADEGATIDASRLESLLSPTIQESERAAAESGGTGITFDAETGTYSLDERVVAKHLDLDKVADAVRGAFADREDSLELGPDQLDVGDGLTAALDRANSYAAAVTTLTLGGQEAYVVDAQKISEWVTIADDLTVSLDTAAIESWCHGELSELLDTVGTARTYTRPDGKTFTVDDGSAKFGSSVYGWSIDGGTAATQIAAALEAGQPSTIDLPCFQTAAKVSADGQDWPDRYIDVDLTEQYARFYNNGTVIWEAPVTTGQPSLGYDTPTGVWQITNRQSGDINLRGPIDPATQEPEWDSHVQFWMGVVRNIVGFHNAPWQSTFGGNIYTYYGSHGCIRLAYDTAEALYNVVQVGDVVVIHN